MPWRPRDRGPGLAARPLPPAFERWVVALEAGSRRPYRAAEWRDAIILVEDGEIELQFRGGTARRFGQGDLLWLTGLEVSAIHNHGPRPAVLVAVRRRLPS